MKKQLFILVLAAGISSCSERTADVHPAMQHSSNPDTVVVQENVVKEINMMDPAIMDGRDIGNLLRDLFLVKDYDGMIRYTASTVLSLHGKEKLRNFYTNAQLQEELNYLSASDEDEVIVLSYSIGAGQRESKLRVVIENDTARVWPIDVESGRIFE